MKLLQFVGYKDRPVFVVAEKITGFCVDGTDPSRVFIQTGPDGADGGANGWSVNGPIEDVARVISDATAE